MAEPARLTNSLSEARALFEAHLRDERVASEHTVRAYAADLGSFEEFLADWAGKPAALDGIDSLAVRGYLGLLYRRGVSAATVNRHLSSIRSLFRFLRREGFPVADPAGETPSPRAKRPLPTFLPVDDAVRLMEMPDASTPEGARDKAIFELLYGSGLRVSELTGAEPRRPGRGGEARPRSRQGEKGANRSHHEGGREGGPQPPGANRGGRRRGRAPVRQQARRENFSGLRALHLPPV